MKRFPLLTSALVLGVLLGGIFALVSLSSAVFAGEDQSILQADHEFVQAAGKGDTATVGRILDTDFTWTDADGKTRSKAEVLESLPTPTLGNENSAQVKQRTYGQVGAVMSSHDKAHVLRIWVRRPTGWRLLVYHEVVLGRQGPGPSVQTKERSRARSHRFLAGAGDRRHQSRRRCLGSAHRRGIRDARFKQRPSSQQSRPHRHSQFAEADRFRCRACPARFGADV